LAILAKISTAFKNVVSERLYFQRLPNSPNVGERGSKKDEEFSCRIGICK